MHFGNLRLPYAVPVLERRFQIAFKEINRRQKFIGVFVFRIKPHRAMQIALGLYAGYNLAATLLGLLAGLGLGAAIVTIINPVVARTGYPLKLTVDASSMAVAFCLGLLFTLATILLAAWTVSRMTVAAALRDLPEPPAPQPSLAHLFGDAFTSTVRFFVAPGMALRSWGALLLAFVMRGPAPFLIGVVLLQRSR